MEQDFGMVLQGIVGLIMLIVFLYMASNIAKLKKHFTEPSSRDFTKEIKLALFKGEKQKALDLYYELAFVFMNQADMQKQNARKLDQISIKMKDLGGTVPDEMTDFIKRHK